MRSYVHGKAHICFDQKTLIPNCVSLSNNVQMGYGSRALALLKKYYEFKIPSIDEEQLPQEHIESVADKNVGLLEERIGKFLNLSVM